MGEQVDYLVNYSFLSIVQLFNCIIPRGEQVDILFYGYYSAILISYTLPKEKLYIT